MIIIATSMTFREERDTRWRFRLDQATCCLPGQDHKMHRAILTVRMCEPECQTCSNDFY